MFNDRLTNMKIMCRRLFERKKDPAPEAYSIRTLESVAPNLHKRVRPTPVLNIQRKAFNVSEFNEDFIQIPTTTSERLEKLKPDLSMKTWIRRLRSLFPITLWLPEYNIRENLIADIVVGITIAAFQVPQSMAYCIIAQVPPIYGLYSSFFPVLIYMILGTSMHISYGTFAATSGVMTGVIVTEVMSELKTATSATAATAVQTVTQSTILSTQSAILYTQSAIVSTQSTIPTAVNQFANVQNIDVAIMAAFIVGIYVLVFGVLQLGFLSNFLPEELLSGFTTSASILVFWSQVGNMLGISLSSLSGPLNLPLSIIECCRRLGETNLYTLAVTAICLVILLIFKFGVNPLWSAKLGIKTPIPIELFVIIGSTAISNYLGLKSAPYKVKVVGTIGNNFPQPLVPRLDLFGIMWGKCIAIAIVGYTLMYSIGKSIGKKHGYTIDPNQEMIAKGVANVFSSFFQCIPSAASLPRTALQDTIGGKTQIVSLVNCLCIVVVILALGRYLEQLPVCVLGVCIAVALFSLVGQIGEVARFWRVSKLDAMIWIITFASVLVISIDIGIYIAIVCSLLLLIWKTSRTKIYLLGALSDLDIYVPINKFNKARAPDGFLIFQLCGPLNFSNAEYFSSELENKCEMKVNSIRKYMKSKKYKQNLSEIQENFNEEIKPIDKLKPIRMALKLNNKFIRLPKYVIIDCSMFSFIDITGITTLKKTILSYEVIGIKTVLSGIHIHLEKMITKEGFFDDISKDLLYKSVHDAVIFLQEMEYIDENKDMDNIYVTTEHWM